jgi:hypothetical protein
MQDDFNNEDFEDLSDADTDDNLYEDEPAGAEVVKSNFQYYWRQG